MTAPVLLTRPVVVAGVAFLLGILTPMGRPAVLGAVLSAVLTVTWARARRPVALIPFVMTFVLAGAAARASADHARATAVDEGLLRGIAEGTEAAVDGVLARAVERGPEEDVYTVELEAVSPTRSGSRVPMRGWARVHARRSGGGALPSCGRPGDRVRFVGAVTPWPTGEPGPRDRPAFAVYLPRRHACVVLEPARGARVGAAIERVRERVHAAIDRALTGDRAGLVRAFATGDRSGISAQTAEGFRVSGLAHLVAVSGLNLAIVSGLFVVALGAVFRRIPEIALGFGARRTAALLALPSVIAYTLLVGATPSAVRAAAMVLVLLAGHLFWRRRDLASALAFAALGMLAADPGALFDPSFQLSFAAVLALMFLHPAIASSLRLEARPAPIRAALEVGAASFAAALGTAPLTAHHFQSISLVGLLANVPAHPISSLILVPLSLLGGLLGIVSDDAARPILTVAGWSAEALVVLARASASIPGASIAVPPPNGLEALLFVGLLGAWAARERFRGATRLAVIFAVLLVSEVAVVSAARVFSDELRLTVLAVGQGDAIVAELPGGHVVVVDTGPSAQAGARSAAERVLVPFLRARRISTIDLLVITHPHADHVGGFLALTEALSVREVWWSGDRREGPDAILDALAVHPGLQTIAHPREITRQFGPVQLERLGPCGPPEDAENVNDGSIVLRIVYGRRAVLLTGDAELAAERALLAEAGPRLTADVLKLGHHGSRTSSSEAFLEAVQPSVAIVSAGRRNSFGFPHAEVLDRLARREVEVLRTDVDGAIEVVTDGETLEVRPARAQAGGASTPGSR